MGEQFLLRGQQDGDLVEWNHRTMCHVRHAALVSKQTVQMISAVGFSQHDGTMQDSHPIGTVGQTLHSRVHG